MSRHSQNNISSNRKWAILATLVGCIGFVIITTTVGFRDQISPFIQSIYGSIYMPVVESGDELSRSVSGNQKSSAVIKLEKEIAELKTENAVLNMKVQELNSTQATINILPDVSVHAVSIKVLGMTGERDSEKLRVRFPDRVVPQKGEAVVGPEGYIGRIESTVQEYALIEMINTEDARLGAMCERTGELGIISWSNELESVVFLPEKSVLDLRDGDLIQTSGLRGSTIVSRIPIGKVASLERNRFGEEVAVVELNQNTNGIQFAVLLQGVGHDTWEESE